MAYNLHPPHLIPAVVYFELEDNGGPRLALQAAHSKELVAKQATNSKECLRWFQILSIAN